MRLGLTRRDENRGQAAASTRKQRLGRRSLSPIFERGAGANGRASGKELLMWHEPEIARSGGEA